MGYDRKPIQHHHNTPRKTQVEVCKTDVHRYYEKTANIFSFLVKEQICHVEPKNRLLAQVVGNMDTSLPMFCE